MKVPGDDVRLKTQDPLLTISIEDDVAVLDLTETQPRLHKRLTARLKRQHEEMLYQTMEKLGFRRIDV